MTAELQFIQGDATRPAMAGQKIIAHVCNDVGGWGAGFVIALSKRWKKPEAEYRQWARNKLPDMPSFGLGEIQFVRVEEEISVANMVAQRDVRWHGETPPIRYEALDQCLDKTGSEAVRLNASVHMPRIGCGLAGGTWDRIEPLIQKRLCARGVRVVVYDYSPPTFQS